MGNNIGSYLSAIGCNPASKNIQRNTDKPPSNVNIDDSITVSNIDIIFDVNGAVCDDILDILKDFERSVTRNELKNAMMMVEEYKQINFFDYYFSNGDTAIHTAVRLQDAGFVYFCLNKGCNVNVRQSITKDTAFHIATENGDVRIMTLLMKFGCDKEMENIEDKKSSDIANENADENAMFLFDNQIQSFFDEKDEKDGKELPRILNDDSRQLRLDAYDSNQVGWRSNKKRNTVGNCVMLDYDEYSGNDELSLDIGSRTVSVTESVTSRTDNTNTKSTNNTSKDGINFAATNIVLKTITFIRMIEIPFEFNGWLHRLIITDQKRRKYKKVYVFIQDLHIIWDKLEPKTKPPLSFNQRNKYNGCLHFMCITDCIPYVSKKKNGGSYKFIIKTYNDNISYLFKCNSIELRNKWINNINSYRKQINSAINNLETSNIDY